MLSFLLSISLLHWLVLVTPGANVLVVMNLAASGQRRAACFAGLGITAVAGIWSALALAGVSAVFAAHPALRLTVQCAGGAYLLHVAVRLWRSPAGGQGVQAVGLSPLAALRLGFLTNILNPKSALFFGGVFAAVLPAAASTAMLVAAVALVLANALLWHLFLALAFSSAPVKAAYARQRQRLNRLAASLVGFFGARLLIQSIPTRPWQ